MTRRTEELVIVHFSLPEIGDESVRSLNAMVDHPSITINRELGFSLLINSEEG